MELSEQQKLTLLQLARYTLTKEISKTASVEPQISSQDSLLQKQAACFVTLLHRGQLRGCIGTLDSEFVLLEAVKRYCLAAATEDPRFPALSAQEVPLLTIEISVLGPMTPLREPSKIRLGHHGLVVAHGSQMGVLLAKVATQFGWNVEEFFEHTCSKAGLDPSRWQQYQWRYFEEVSFSERDFQSSGTTLNR